MLCCPLVLPKKSMRNSVAEKEGPFPSAETQCPGRFGWGPWFQHHFKYKILLSWQISIAHLHPYSKVIKDLGPRTETCWEVIPQEATWFIPAFGADLPFRELGWEVSAFLPWRWRREAQMWRQRCLRSSPVCWFCWQAARDASSTPAAARAGSSFVRRARWSRFPGTSPPTPPNCK